MTNRMPLLRDLSLCALLASSVACEPDCLDEPIELDTLDWSGFSPELQTPRSPFQMRELVLTRTLDWGCMVEFQNERVEQPTPILQADGETVELLRDRLDPALWWPASGAWPADSLRLTGIQQRGGDAWRLDIPIPVREPYLGGPLDPASLRGRTYRLTQVEESSGLGSLLDALGEDRLRLGFTDEDDPKPLIFDATPPAANRQCFVPLQWKAAGGQDTLYLPELEPEYAVYQGDPTWEVVDPVLGPARLQLWQEGAFLRGHGSAELTLSSIAWLSEGQPEELAMVLNSVGIFPEPCGSADHCLPATVYDLWLEPVQTPLPEEDCGGQLAGPPLWCAVVNAPLTGGPILVAWLLLWNRRREARM